MAIGFHRLLLAFLIAETLSAFQIRPASRPNANRQLTAPLPIEYRSPSVDGRSCLFSTSDNVDTSSAELSAMFKEASGADGLITKAGLLKTGDIKDLLEEGELLESELSEIWESFSGGRDAVNLDAFIEIYQAIDDLFEDDDVEEVDETEEAIEKEPESFPLADNEEARIELEAIFSVISDDGVLSKEGMRNWEEIETLLKDGMLDEPEFEELWEGCPKVDKDSISIEGFMFFNSKLDTLFEFEDDDLDPQEGMKEEASAPSPETIPTSTSDAVKDSLFSTIAGGNGLVSIRDLAKWEELTEMLDDGDILKEEVEQMFSEALKQSSDSTSLDSNAFDNLLASIDDLFEDEEDGGGEENRDSVETVAEPTVGQSTESKNDLLRALDLMSERNEDDERLPCGLETSEKEDKLIVGLANELTSDRSNWVLQRQGDIEMADLSGTWELLFTSSSAMKFNKGLSGIGGSFPNGKFGGLKQKLVATKFLADVEYKERVEVNPSSASFDVTVDGNWEIRRSVSLFTGEPSVVLAVDPQRVMYGPTNTKADHWKSLGPTNILDLVYLDEDLRIMRGSTSVDTILIFRRIE